MKREKHPKAGRVLVCLSVTAAAALAGFLLWWFGAFLPRWILWTGEKTLIFSADEQTLEVRLAHRQAAVCRENGTNTLPPISAAAGTGAENASGKAGGGTDAQQLWNSNRRYLVQNMLTGDIDGDGQEELILLLWKHGSYGRYRPFWEKGPDIAWTQHIFIYRFENGSMRSMWGSSGLGIEITDFSIDGDSRIHVYESDGQESIWQWHQFGLALVG